MRYSVIEVTKRDGGRIATVTLNRPERLNAWGAGMSEEVAHAFRELGRDADVRAIVLTGAGDRAFSAGADLKDPMTHKVPNLEERLAEISPEGMEVFNAIQYNPRPVVSAVNGYALGIGCLVTLCTDLIVASDRAVFGLPQVSLGILPAYGGALRLLRFVSKPIASELILLSRKIDAHEAYRIGMVNRVVPANRLLDEAYELAKALAAMPPLAVKLAKESINQSLDIGSLQHAAQADIYRFAMLAMTQETSTRHDAWRAAKGLGPMTAR